MREKTTLISKSVKNTPLFEQVCSFVGQKLDRQVEDLVYIKPGKSPSVYRVECVGGEDLRMDMDYPARLVAVQAFLYKNGINIPKPVRHVAKRNQYFSEWIDGKVIKEVWKRDSVFIKQGEWMAKFNNLEYPRHRHYMTNTDINATNFIWTPEEEIYLVDFGKVLTTTHIKPEDGPKSVNRTVATGIMKNLQYWPIEDRRRSPRKKMELFLEGYKKHRGIKSIVEILDKYDWTFSNYTKSKK